MGTKLSDGEIQRALAELTDWKRVADTIERNFEFSDFRDAITFVNRVADAAEEANHHPDITIIYNKVKRALTSHDSGGVTTRDVKMAKRIDELAG